VTYVKHIAIYLCIFALCIDAIYKYTNCLQVNIHIQIYTHPICQNISRGNIKNMGLFIYFVILRRRMGKNFVKIFCIEKFITEWKGV
jgi:hypothetical protein